MLFNQELISTGCLVEESTKNEDNWSHLDWIEWHANTLAPRILMPKCHTQQKVEELISHYKEINPMDSITKVMRSVIRDTANFLGVSKLTAKIRLIDLGYKEVIGINTFIDGRYIDDYTFNPSVLKDNQTFDIGLKDALFEYATNTNFRDLLDSGKYLYIDNHFCINHPNYVDYNEDGVLQLTDYALSHLDECCLVFDIEVNRTHGIKYYQEKVLYRNAVSDTSIELKFQNNSQNKVIDLRAEEYKKYGYEAKQVASIIRSLPASFSETLKYHMDRVQVTEEELAEESSISARTIQRIRNNITYTPKLSTIIAICVGLHLQPALSMDLVTKAGYGFK